jgi:hypothetical protein
MNVRIVRAGADADAGPGAGHCCSSTLVEGIVRCGSSSAVGAASEWGGSADPAEDPGLSGTCSLDCMGVPGRDSCCSPFGPS